MDLTKKTIFLDYEGVLCETPAESPTLNELLFEKPFSKLKPITKIQKLLEKVNPKRIYVLGVVDTNNEIQQKYFWLEKHFPHIEDQNVVFVSSGVKKVDVIKAYQTKLGLKANEIVFIDDKEKHLAPARDAGFECYNVEEI